MSCYIKALLIIGVIIYIGIIYESGPIILLALFSIIFMVVSFVYLRYRIRRIKASIDIPIIISEKDKPLQIHIKLKNKTKLYCNKAKVKIKYGNAFSKNKKRKWVKASSIAPGLNSNIVKVSLNSEGTYDFEIKKLRVYDLLGIFYMDTRVNKQKSAIVLPEFSSIPVTLGENVRNFFGDADVYDDVRPGYDPAETFEVREFRDGDRIQSVHWKLSAKTDDLVVKENSLPKACPIVFYLDGTNSSNNLQIEKLNMGFLEAFASISFSLMDAGCPHFVTWYSRRQGEIIRVRVDDEESFYLALTMYMQDGNRTEKKDLVEQYSIKYRGEQYVHSLYLSTSKLLMDGEPTGALIL